MRCTGRALTENIVMARVATTAPSPTEPSVEPSEITGLVKIDSCWFQWLRPATGDNGEDHNLDGEEVADEDRSDVDAQDGQQRDHGSEIVAAHGQPRRYRFTMYAPQLSLAPVRNVRLGATAVFPLDFAATIDIPVVEPMPGQPAVNMLGGEIRLSASAPISGSTREAYPCGTCRRGVARRPSRRRTLVDLWVSRSLMWINERQR